MEEFIVVGMAVSGFVLGWIGCEVYEFFRRERERGGGGKKSC